jgi:phosphosulfolactate phosphohydrolase-like enzyme
MSVLQPASVRWSMRRLREMGRTADQVEAAMLTLDVRPVLTAHPTESTRSTLLGLQARVADKLLARERAPADEARLIEQELEGEVELLWLTSEVRQDRPTVLDEVSSALWYLETRLLDAGAHVHSALAIAFEEEFSRSAVTLAGEQNMHPIAGFDLGNSPQEFTNSAVEGKTILITTTNGTRALLGVQGARDIVIASYVNFTAVLALMKVAASSNTDIAIICAGEEGSFTLEDAACAGRYVRAIPKRAGSVVLNDAASASVLIEKKYGDNIAKVFKESFHGQALESAGFGDDLAAAAEVDAYSVVPIYQDRQITKLGPERAR